MVTTSSDLGPFLVTFSFLRVVMAINSDSQNPYGVNTKAEGYMTPTRANQD